MNKNTFEYLSNNNAEGETDQFFVIQDDGTFLFNRQVQFVTEVEDVNEAIESTPACAIFDVNPQQYFVDVTNSTELISAPENFILPSPIQDQGNNMYGNNFLLQTVDSENSEQSEKVVPVTVQFKESGEQVSDVINVINKQGITCTEITLSDEQYKNLEQKGWVLLENNGKIYILDSFGLHEVTNQDLVQNLKDEPNSDLPEEADTKGSVKENSALCSLNIDDTAQTSILEQDSVEVTNINIVKENSEENSLKINILSHSEGQTEEVEDENFKQEPNIEKKCIVYPEPQKFKSSNIKILTKYCFKDIPDKINIGRTRNGKKLIAKVVKRTVNNRKNENSNEVSPQGGTIEPDKARETAMKEDQSNDIDDIDFEQLVKRAVEGEALCSSAEVVEASDVITQLFQVPEFRKTVAGRNLVITRVTEELTLFKRSRSISFVSGVVKSAEADGLIFIHVPNLLQKLTCEYEDYLRTRSSKSILKTVSERVPDCKILQVLISETKHNGVQAISFILNERFLPCQFANNKVYPRKINKFHVCSACAAVFQSVTELMDHQEIHAVESDGALTIDTEKLPKDIQTYTVMQNRYYIMKTDKGSEYCCFQCNRKFNKLSNCIRHMKSTHSYKKCNKSDKTNEDCSNTECDDDQCDKYHEDEGYKSVELQEAPYKCKMCTCAFYYPASLTKHISKAHIMVKVNTFNKT